MIDPSRGRDESIDRLLRQSLRMPEDAAEPGPACLDAETLAAWFDGGLKGAALERAQAHASNCPRCRSFVSAMARTGAAADALAGAADLAASRAAKARRHSPFRWLAWAAPLSAAAAVVIWTVVPGERTPAPTMSEVERPAAVAQVPPEPAAGAPATAGGTTAAPAARSVDAQSAPAASPGETTNEAQAPALRRELRRDALQDQAGARAAEPSPPSAAGSAAAAPPAETFAKVAETVAVAPIIPSPDPSIRWRLMGSAVERSTDGEATWDVVFTGAGQGLTAGSAPSSTTCWVVGRGGIVLRSTDGRNFTRETFPEATDLTAVQAADDQSASVTTADGRTFVTSNGGTTWAPTRN